MLEVDSLGVSYGSLAAVRGVSFAVDAGQLLTIVGPNGAGKSSTVMAVAGGHGGGRGRAKVTVTGSVKLDGKELLGRPPDEIVRRGLSLVPEGRRIFGNLTVAENLVVARATRRDRKAADQQVSELLDRFPTLAISLRRPAALLSGGQQQQLALARALLTKPRVLLLDEPSLGLAPILVDGAFDMIESLRDEGLAVVLIEQNALRATEAANRALLMRNGVTEAIPHGRDGQLMLAAYFGIKNIQGLEAS